MTPTEQDKELRTEIARKVYPKPTPGEIMTFGTPEAVVEMYADSPIVYAFANFITADRERVALEARISGKWEILSKIPDVTSVLENGKICSAYNLRIKVNREIAELKAQ